MKLEFEDYLSETDNIYDLVGNCFGLLCENIDNHQAFIGEYISIGNKRKGKNNPNYEKLQIFSNNIMKLLQDYKPSKYEKIRNNILREVEELELDPYQEHKKNCLTVIYSILSAIDACAMEWNTKWMHRELGPLDRQGKTCYRVYFSPRETIHREYIDEIKRNRISDSGFFESFESFRFVDEEGWSQKIGTPRIKFISIPEHIKGKLREEKKLKIAVIPAPEEKNFSFDEVKGAGIRVKYYQPQNSLLINKICEGVEIAIQEGAHMIMLPEYVVEPAIYEAIRSCLVKTRSNLEKKDYLLALFAGSTWTEDDNNKMSILDAEGNLLGEYYKYSPFVKKDKRTHSYECYEALSNPGKKCDLIAIEDIGVILPAICRDVIDGVYTEKLIKTLLPVFIMIAAWSSSVASFEVRQREYACKYFTSTVLCNACGAVDAKKDKIGNGSIVVKKDTIADCNIRSIQRYSCEGGCCKEGVCLYIMEYTFSGCKDNDITVHKYLVSGEEDS